MRTVPEPRADSPMRLLRVPRHDTIPRPVRESRKAPAMSLRRTRIVATPGPATDRPGVLEALLDARLDVARINCSHGTAAEHVARVARLRALTDHRPRPVAVLADLPGPKLRVL